VRAVRWLDETGQARRFEVLCEVGDLEGATLADVGCGLGDLFGHLRARGASARYVGYDITPGMVEAARAKYPEARFELRDVLAEGLGGPFDYVFASGTFNIRIPDHDAFLREMLAVMFAGCRRAVAFNILRPLAEELPEPFATWAREQYYEIEPDALVPDCRALGAEVEAREGYLPGEFALYLRRPAPLQEQRSPHIISPE
jgi:trans-aconitate methyltransferase